MEKSGSTFEERLMDIEGDILSAAAEYVDGKAEFIYVLCRDTGTSVNNDFFFKIGGVIREKTEVNEGKRFFERKHDISPMRQMGTTMEIANCQMNIKKLFREAGRQEPAFIKLEYNNDTGRLEMECGYDELDPELFQKWVKEKREQSAAAGRR